MKVSWLASKTVETFYLEDIEACCWDKRRICIGIMRIAQSENQQLCMRSCWSVTQALSALQQVSICAPVCGNTVPQLFHDLLHDKVTPCMYNQAGLLVLWSSLQVDYHQLSSCTKAEGSKCKIERSIDPGKHIDKNQFRIRPLGYVLPHTSTKDPFYVQLCLIKGHQGRQSAPETSHGIALASYIKTHNLRTGIAVCSTKQVHLLHWHRSVDCSTVAKFETR